MKITLSFIGAVSMLFSMSVSAVSAAPAWPPFGADTFGLPAAAAGIPEVSAPSASDGDLLVPEFSTMGRYEGGRVDALQSVVGIETYVAAGGPAGFVRLEMKYPRIQKDDAALALDPGALTMTADIPSAYYSGMFESPRFFLKQWASGGKLVQGYSGYNDRSLYIEITQRTPVSSGGYWTEVMKLTVVKSEIIMGKVEKYAPGSDEAYFDEYIVMAEKVAAGLALRGPGLLGRISEPSLIKYVVESPTPERINEAIGGAAPLSYDRRLIRF